MIENYYYGKLFICLKSGYKEVVGENGIKYVVFTMPRLQNTGYTLCKQDNYKYIDIRTNKRIEKFYRYEMVEKGNLYFKDIIPIKKALKQFTLKDKLQILKTIILIEATNRLGKITSIEKEKSSNVLTKNK